MSNENRLGRLVEMASKISGRSQCKLLVIYNWQVLRRANAVLDPLQMEFELLLLGHHFRAPVCRTKSATDILSGT